MKKLIHSEQELLAFLDLPEAGLGSLKFIFNAQDMKKAQSVFSVKLCERLMPNDFYDNIFVAGNSIFYI